MSAVGDGLAVRAGGHGSRTSSRRKPRLPRQRSSRAPAGNVQFRTPMSTWVYPEAYGRPDGWRRPVTMEHPPCRAPGTPPAVPRQPSMKPTDSRKLSVE